MIKKNKLLAIIFLVSFLLTTQVPTLSLLYDILFILGMGLIYYEAKYKLIGYLSVKMCGVFKASFLLKEIGMVYFPGWIYISKSVLFSL